jgi:hypothetical protein
MCEERSIVVVREGDELVSVVRATLKGRQNSTSWATEDEESRVKGGRNAPEPGRSAVVF